MVFSRIVIAALFFTNVGPICNAYKSLLEAAVQYYSMPFNISTFSQTFNLVILSLSATTLLHISICSGISDKACSNQTYWDYIKSSGFPFSVKEVILYPVYSIMVVSCNWDFLFSSLIGLLTFASLNILIKSSLDLSSHKTFVYTLFVFVAYNMTKEKWFQEYLGMNSIVITLLITLMLVLFVMFFAALFTQDGFSRPVTSEHWFAAIKGFLSSGEFCLRSTCLLRSKAFWWGLVRVIFFVLIGWAFRYWIKDIFTYYSLWSSGFTWVYIVVSSVSLIRILIRLVDGAVTSWTPSGLLGKISYSSLIFMAFTSVICWVIYDFGTMSMESGKPLHIKQVPSDSYPGGAAYEAVGESGQRLIGADGEKVSLIGGIPDALLIPIPEDGIVPLGYVKATYYSGEIGMASKKVFDDFFHDYCLNSVGKEISDKIHLTTVNNPNDIKPSSIYFRIMRQGAHKLSDLTPAWFPYLKQIYEKKEGFKLQNEGMLLASNSRVNVTAINHYNNLHTLMYLAALDSPVTFGVMMHECSLYLSKLPECSTVYTLFIKGEIIIPCIYQNGWAQSVNLANRHHIPDFLCFYISDQGIRILPQYDVDFPSIKAYKITEENTSLYPILSWCARNTICPTVDSSLEVVRSKIPALIDAQGRPEELKPHQTPVSIGINHVSASVSWDANKPHSYELGHVVHNGTELGLNITKKFITKEGNISLQVFNQTVAAQEQTAE